MDTGKQRLETVQCKNTSHWKITTYIVDPVYVMAND